MYEPIVIDASDVFPVIYAIQCTIYQLESQVDILEDRLGAMGSSSPSLYGHWTEQRVIKLQALNLYRALEDKYNV